MEKLAPSLLSLPPAPFFLFWLLVLSLPSLLLRMQESGPLTFFLGTLISSSSSSSPTPWKVTFLFGMTGLRSLPWAEPRERMQIKGSGRGYSPRKSPSTTNNHPVRTRSSSGGEGAQNEGPKGKLAARRPPGLGSASKRVAGAGAEGRWRRGAPHGQPPPLTKKGRLPHVPPPIPSPRSPGCDGDPRADTLSSTPSSLRARGAWTDPGPGVLATPSAPR